MHIKTILNRDYKHGGFVYGAARFDETHGDIEVEVRARANSQPRCSNCTRWLLLKRPENLTKSRT